MKIHMLFPALSLCSIIACSLYGTVSETPNPLAMVPLPSSMEKHTGEITLHDTTAILASPDLSVRKTAALLAGHIAEAGGPAVPVKDYAGARPGGAVILALDRNAPAGGESYELTIREDGVLLRMDYHSERHTRIFI